MKTILNYINENKSLEDEMFKDNKLASVYSSLILYASTNLKDFMENLNMLGPDTDKLSETDVKKYLQHLDNILAEVYGTEYNELSFK